MKITKICQTCGKDFKVFLCRQRIKYCSRKCYDSSTQRKNITSLLIGIQTQKNKKRFEYEASPNFCNCGEPLPYHNKNGKFCSHQCYTISLKGQITIPYEIVKNLNRTYSRPGRKNPNYSQYKRYRNKVTRLTEKTYKQFQSTLNPNNYIRTLCGVNGGYQIDHIETVKECFQKGYPEEYVARLENLQLLPWKINLMKEKVLSI